MILSIHQPEFLPWYGYIHKLYHSDIFVILDDVQFKKNYFENRNKILTKNGPIWITIPVVSKDRLDNTIRTTKINWHKDWRKKVISTIQQTYSKYSFYDEIKPLLEIFDIKYETIYELNMAIINFIIKLLDIDTKIIIQSELNTTKHKNDLLLEICQKLDVDKYMMNMNGSDYFEYELFKENNIEVIHHDFKHIRYDQKNSSDKFIDYMSFVDIIANIGKDGLLEELRNNV